MRNNPSLPGSVRLMVDKRNTIVARTASAWEVATKVRLGRLPAASAASDVTRNFQEYLKQSGFETLPVSGVLGISAGLVPGPQRDPVDRMVIAQAQQENLAIVTD
jgi:PIN domain nuclease of toxin-antitoxin system